MELREHDTVSDFLDAATPLLVADEARHNLAFGICSTLAEAPETYPEFHLWTVQDGGETAAAALMTPPYNVWVGKPRDPAALEVLVDGLVAAGVDPPGVTGARPEVEQFASVWERRRGAERRLRVAMGIYAVERVVVPGDVPGSMRPVAAGDRQLMIDWFEAFEREALSEDAPRQNIEEQVDRRLAGKAGALAVWEDGEVVSFLGYGGETPNGIRIGPVYTPPACRGRGYASALTAQVSRQLLDEGRSYCFLFTNLANPTANRIYQRIGYEFLAESADYAFESHP